MKEMAIKFVAGLTEASVKCSCRELCAETDSERDTEREKENIGRRVDRRYFDFLNKQRKIKTESCFYFKKHAWLFFTRSNLGA